MACNTCLAPSGVHARMCSVPPSVHKMFPHTPCFSGPCAQQVSSALSLEACTNGWPLTTVCMWIFQVHDVLGPMCIKPQTMQQYLLRIEAGYLAQNAYHNRAHAADVTLQMYALLQNCFQLSTMPHQAACSLLLTSTLAAAVHDFMHPGSNNQ